MFEAYEMPALSGKTADYTEKSASGTSREYRLNPSNLVVDSEVSSDSAVTLTWQGGADPEVLKSFFVSVAEICGWQKLAVRTWFIDLEQGAGEYCMPAELLRNFSGNDLVAGGFLRLDVFDPSQSDDPPYLSLYANLDTAAENLDEYQGYISVSADVDDLGRINEQICDLIVQTESDLFETRYDRRAVTERLSCVISDLRSDLAAA